MDTLHKQVLTLLGFTAVGYGIAKIGAQWGLYNRHTDKIVLDGDFGFETESDAWAQAPELEALMSPLRRLMATEMTLITDCHPSGKWFVGLSSWQGGANGTKMILFEADLAESHDDEATAIAMLFIAACNAGHIDPSKVVL